MIDYLFILWTSAVIKHTTLMQFHFKVPYYSSHCHCLQPTAKFPARASSVPALRIMLVAGDDQSISIH